MKRYQETLQQVLYDRSFLGKTHLAHVMFEESFPASGAETDRGIGSLATSGAKKVLNALKSWGFNVLQQGPAGIQGFTPYESTRFALNPWFIPLSPLTKPQWGELLTPDEVQTVLNDQKHHAPDQINRGFIYHSQKQLLDQAYQRFKAQSATAPKNSPLAKLKRDFETFVRLNTSPNPYQTTPLERNALYSALAKAYNSENPADWPKGYQNLFRKPVLSPGALAYANHIKTAYADAYNADLFNQFLAETFRQKGLRQAKEVGLKVFGDLSSVVASRDEWAYKHLFLNGIRLGTPEDIFSETGQPFNGAVLNPNLIGETHAQKGTLGPAGEWLKQVILRALHLSPDGIRVDHAQGWADPWVYLTGHTPHSQDGGARLLSTPGCGLTENGPLKAFKSLLARLAIPTPGQIKPNTAPPDEDRVMNLTPDQVAQYGKPYAILMDLLKQKGLPQEALVSEDLGAITDPMNQVMDQFNLSRMRVTLYRGKEDSKYHFNQFAPHDWAMFGTHDMETVWEAAQKDIDAIAQNTAQKATAQRRVDQLGVWLFPQHTPTENAARAAFIKEAQTNVSTRVHGELAALLASRAKNIQITMSDYFGLRRFNTPGTDNPENFTLRLTPNFEEKYYQDVKNHQAVNMPKVLRLALHARGLDSQHKDVMLRLESFEKELQQ